jgi:hypothetical protein
MGWRRQSHHALSSPRRSLVNDDSMTRAHVVVLAAYCAATAVLLLMVMSVLVLAEGRDRLRLVAQLNAWVPGSLSMVGLLWLVSSVSAIIVAYRLRARLLALAVAGSYGVTTALIYAWASAMPSLALALGTCSGT